jgi:hypothetical protein
MNSTFPVCIKAACSIAISIPFTSSVKNASHFHNSDNSTPFDKVCIVIIGTQDKNVN